MKKSMNMLKGEVIFIELETSNKDCEMYAVKPFHIMTLSKDKQKETPLNISFFK